MITRSDSLEAISVRIKQLLEETLCEFCHETYHDPRVLDSCLHVYCKRCIAFMQVKGEYRRYKCPQCSEYHHIPDIDLLPAYNVVVETKKRDIRLLMQIGREKEPLCNICRKANAEFVCQDCPDEKRLLCSKCSSPHNKDRTYADHNLDLLSCVYSQISRARATRKVENTRNNTEETTKWNRWNRTKSLILSDCQEHGLELRYLCQTCNQTACYACCEQLHEHHKVFFVEGAIDNARKLVASEITLVDSIERELLLATKPIEQTKQILVGKEDHLELEIKSRFSRIRKAIDQQEKEMQAQLKSVLTERREKLSRQAKQITKLADKAMRLKTHMTDIVESTDDRALLNLTDLLLHKSSELKSEYLQAVSTALYQNRQQQPHWNQSCDSVPSLVVCEDAKLGIHIPANQVNHLLREASVVHQVTADPSKCQAKGPGLLYAKALEMSYFQVILRDAHGSWCTQRQQVSVSICFNAGTSYFLEKSSVIQKSNSTYLVTFCPRRAGTCTIQVLVNQEDISGSPFLINVSHPCSLSPVSKLFGTMGGKDQAGVPNCIALDDEGNLYVCTKGVPSSVIVFNQCGEQLFMFERKGKGTGESSGIAIGSDRSVYITSCGSHSLSKYDPTGMLVKLVGKRGKGCGEFNSPNGIAINSDGEVCVCDSFNCRIQIFDCDLQYKRQICTDFTTTDGLHHLSQPFGITFNQMGMMFATDPCNHCILVFGHNEHFYKSFGKEGSCLGELRDPKYLATDLDEYIYVADSGNHRVAVFHSSSGDPVTSLGCFGTGEEDNCLNSPCGIGVNDSGLIFVCDSGNKRIQVFRDDIIKLSH